MSEGQVAIPKINVKEAHRRKAQSRAEGYKVTVVETEVAKSKYGAKTESIERRLGKVEEAIPFDELVTIEESVALILNNYGVLSNDRVAYLNFARHLYKMVRKYGFIKSSYLRSQVLRWRSLGCSEKILNDIASLFSNYVREVREAGGEGGAVNL